MMTIDGGRERRKSMCIRERPLLTMRRKLTRTRESHAGQEGTRRERESEKNRERRGTRYSGDGLVRG